MLGQKCPISLEGASGIWDPHLDAFCLLAWLLLVYVDNSSRITKSIKTKRKKISSIINRKKKTFPLQDNRLLDYTDFTVQIVLVRLFTYRFKQ